MILDKTINSENVLSENITVFNFMLNVVKIKGRVKMGVINKKSSEMASASR